MKDNAYDAAVRYILRRPHTEYELLIKLKRKSYNIEEINIAIDNLKKEGHVDDARLALDLVVWHNKTRPMGSFGLRQSLRKKGIKQQYIEAAIEKNLTADLETRLLFELAQKKLENLVKIYRRAHEPPQQSSLSANSAAGDREVLSVSSEPDQVRDRVPAEVRERLARFLLSRGFDNQLVITVLEKLVEGED